MKSGMLDRAHILTHKYPPPCAARSSSSPLQGGRHALGRPALRPHSTTSSPSPAKRLRRHLHDPRHQ
eukprot:17870-Eustigmatos_ZCMA.PRE.1